MQTHDSAAAGQTKRSYTVQEIMDILEIGKTTAYKFVHSGVFPVHKVGTRIRIPKAPFDEWFDKQEQI